MQASTVHSTMPDDQKAQMLRSRETKHWHNVCADASIEQLERMRDHHQAKLDHPYKRATERAWIINSAAVQECSAELARRKVERPKLRALPSLWQPLRAETGLIAMLSAERVRWMRQQFRVVEG